MKKEILCSISTRGRYDTTLPLALLSIANQTLLPDKLVVFDDNDEPKDVRQIQHYQYIFQIFNEKNVQWEWLFAAKKGQHYNHHIANHMGYKWVWRMDDDTVAEPNVLKTLYSHTTEHVGAIGGAVLTPPLTTLANCTGKIQNIDSEPNIQWHYIKDKKEVDHLHCSFLYRSGVAEYNLNLSRVAHREETLFTYELVQKGYKNYVVPDAITWHLRNKEGGIRDGQIELYKHDENIFRNLLLFDKKTIVVLDCGMGDHIVFKKVLKDIENPEVFTCYPDIIPGKSIAEAQHLFGNLDKFNIYAKMDQWNWTGSLEDAFRKLYLSASHESNIVENHITTLSWLREKHQEIFNEVIESNAYNIKREDIEGKNIIDVGANVGMFSIFSAYLGAKKVLCAEPARETYNQLIENIKISKFENIHAFNNVVADVEGKEFKLNILNDSGHNSLYDNSTVQETIQSITLINLLDQVEGDTILKIDCEGSEYDIIMNIEKEALSKVVGLHMEIHADLHPVYKGFEIIEHKLIELGFVKLVDKPMYKYILNDKKEIIQYEPLPIKVCYFTKIKL